MAENVYLENNKRNFFLHLSVYVNKCE